MAESAEVQRVIVAAMLAAGPIRGNDAWGWRQRVRLLIPEVANIFDEQSREWQRASAMLDASHFSGTYLGYELEESSTRLIVTIDAGQVDRKTGEKMMDTIRTERTDGAFGQAMQHKLDGFEVGDTVHVWKVNEPMANDPMSNVRILYHIVRIGRAKRPEQQAPAGTVASKLAPGNDRVSDAMDRLSSKERVDVAQRCRAAGITNFMEPGDDVSRVLSIIEDVVEER